MPIRARLALVIGGAVLLVAVAISGAAYQAVRSTELEAAVERLAGASARVAGLLDESIASMGADIREMAALPAVVDVLNAGGVQADATRERVLAEVGTNPEDVVELLGPSGELVLSTDPERSALLGPARARVPGSLEDAPETLVGPLLAVRDSLYLVLHEAVRVEGEVVGFVARWQHTGTDDGDREMIEGLIGPGAGLYLTNRDGTLWSDLQRVVEPLPVRTDTSAGTRFRRGDGDAWIAATAPMVTAPWAVVTTRPEADVVAPALATLQQLALIGLGVLALALVGAWLVSGSLTRPLRALAGAAGAFREGDLDQRVDPGSGGELGELSRAFNSMADGLAAAREEREARIRELTESREQHRASQERLEHVLASSGAVLYQLDVSGGDARLAWVSDNLATVLGYTPDEARVADWWRSRVHPDELPTLAGWVAHRSGDVAPRQYRFRNGAGEYRWLRDEQHPIRGEGGSITEVAGSWIDVTEQRELEGQYRQSQKLEAVGRLAGGVAHDFNNILTVVLVECAEALRTLSGDHPARASIQIVQGAGESAAHLTRQLLAFSRKDMAQPAVLDLNEVIRGVHSMFQRMVGETVKLELGLGRDLGFVRADRGQIEQVLANFVVNARDAMPDGGVVRVETAAVSLDRDYAAGHVEVVPGEYVSVSVADAGVGMTADVKEHLFEPFFTTKPPGEGTGLGLATCYAIAKQAGGHIGVYSELGLGTTVRLYLPRVSAPEEASPPPVRPAPPGGEEVVLLVEDDEAVRVTACRLLTRLGYTVYEATDGAAALDALRGLDHVDLMVTDMVMPGMGGRELAEHAHADRPTLKVLFMSGYTDDVIMRKDLLDKEVAFIQKPFTVAVLARKVREVLDRG